MAVVSVREEWQKREPFKRVFYRKSKTYPRWPGILISYLSSVPDLSAETPSGDIGRGICWFLHVNELRTVVFGNGILQGPEALELGGDDTMKVCRIMEKGNAGMDEL